MLGALVGHALGSGTLASHVLGFEPHEDVLVSVTRVGCDSGSRTHGKGAWGLVAALN